MTISEEVAAEETLARSLERYAGRWVGIYNHHLVTDAATLEELLGAIATHPEETEIFQVADDPHAICCF